MAKKDARSLMRKQLGKETADAMLSKVDKMVRQGATAAQIEKAFADDLAAHIEKQVVSTVIAKIGPITPITVKPIQSDIKSKISGAVALGIKLGPSTSIKTTPPIKVTSVKVGPGPFTKGSK